MHRLNLYIRFMTNLSTTAKITWCPGCPNSQILVAFRQTIEGMVNSGSLKIENLVACAGIYKR